MNYDSSDTINRWMKKHNSSFVYCVGDVDNTREIDREEPRGPPGGVWDGHWEKGDLADGRRVADNG